jgi:hypothetical protein
MNDALGRKSHAVTWVVSVLTVLLLYAASWPPIELKVCGGNPYFGFSNIKRPPAPAWIISLYKPMHFMDDLLWGHGDPLGRYYSWWRQKLSL